MGSFLKNLIRALDSSRSSTVRSYSSGSLSIYSKISQESDKSRRNPNLSLVPVLNRWIKDGNSASASELQQIIRDLRKRNLYPQALEVSEWMIDKDMCKLNSQDHAVRLDLIGKVRGLASAESYFHRVGKEDKTEKTYGALLNCYVRDGLTEKALLHMEMMKELGFASLAMPYNDIMRLFANLGQHEMVPSLLAEMKENKVLPDNFSYIMCINSYGMRSDFDNMEKVLKEMEFQRHITIDWNIYSTVANFYIKANLSDKAIASLKKAEKKLLMKTDPAGFNHLISLHCKLGKVPEILRLWKLQSSMCRHTNKDYIIVLRSLVKLGEFEEAEALLNEWEYESKCSYDIRVPNALLAGYCREGLLEKADVIIREIAEKKGKTAVASCYGLMAKGCVDKDMMEKATDYMKKALSVAHGKEVWKPNGEVIKKILGWLRYNGDVDEVEAFVALLTQVMPIDIQMYHALIKANIRAGRETKGILKRMKDDNVELNGETKKILRSKVKSST